MISTPVAIPSPVRVELQLGDGASSLHIHLPDGANHRRELALGVTDLVSRYLRHSPPSPLEMESAITVVEDVVMPVYRELPAHARLETADAALHGLALACGVPPAESMVWTRDALEASFNRLASVVMGSPAAQAGVPLDGTSVARLLILRECLHHWGYDALTVHTP